MAPRPVATVFATATSGPCQLLCMQCQGMSRIIEANLSTLLQLSQHTSPSTEISRQDTERVHPASTRPEAPRRMARVASRRAGELREWIELKLNPVKRQERYLRRLQLALGLERSERGGQDGYALAVALHEKERMCRGVQKEFFGIVGYRS